MFLEDCKKDEKAICLGYFATADFGLAEVLRANPIKMLVYYNEKLIPIRRYNCLDFLTEDELDTYSTESKVRLRAEAVQSIDFHSLKMMLINELESFFAK